VLRHLTAREDRVTFDVTIATFNGWRVRYLAMVAIFTGNCATFSESATFSGVVTYNGATLGVKLHLIEHTIKYRASSKCLQGGIKHVYMYFIFLAHSFSKINDVKCIFVVWQSINEK
jgi:hypothetical protein